MTARLVATALICVLFTTGANGENHLSTSAATKYPTDGRERLIATYAWLPEHKKWSRLASGASPRDAEPSFEKGWFMIETADREEAYYVYIFVNGKRAFKSPPSNYLGGSDGPYHYDLDLNGVADAVWDSRTDIPEDYSTIISMNLGTDNYFFHCNNEHDDTGRPAHIEFDRKLPVHMIQLVTIAAGGGCTPELEDRLQNFDYKDLSDTSALFPSLRKLHVKALSEYRTALKKYKNNPDKLNRAIIEAIDPLSAKILAYRDFRAIDPDNKNPEYTAILNDVGFLYDTAGAHEYATAFLEYVVQRDPNRAVARLNYADALYDYLQTAPEDRFTQPLPTDDPKPQYRAYYDLMVQTGKKDKIPPRVLERMK